MSERPFKAHNNDGDSPRHRDWRFMKPVVLLVTASRWFPTARLGMALANAGWAVHVLCPSGHPIGVTDAAECIHALYGLTPLRSLKTAIRKSQPLILIPCDDTAVQYVYRLYGCEAYRGETDGPVCALIERSLGSTASFPVIESRTAFANLAAQEGIRTPEAETLSDLNQLKDWIERVGLPAVIKADGTSGGDGVRVARSIDEAEHAFRKLQAPPLLARALKRAIIDRDTTLVWPSLLRKRFNVSGQSFIKGREATTTLACWKGSILASLHFEVINKSDATGPSTVLRLIDNAEMALATEKMVRRLGLSGLIGFDFMIEDATGNAYLIEINPRSTQVGHLPLGLRRNLPVALWRAATGLPMEDPPAVTEKDTIALFPFEWLKNPKSPYLFSGYHDVPWDEAEFIRVCVGTRRKQQDLYTLRKWSHTLAPARVAER
jgi:Carbamoyl-phosphate synthase L chain, ATP binding domain